MKHAKKLFSMMLALAMAFSLAVPAMAAEDDYTITITNPNPEASADHIYEAFQILSGSLSQDGTTLSNIVWGANIGDVNGAKLLKHLRGEKVEDEEEPDTFFGEDGSNPFSDDDSAEKFAETISQPSFNTIANMEHLARVIEKYLIESATGTSTENDAPYTIKIPKAKAGYYLIKDKDGSLDQEINRDYTQYMLQVVNNVEIAHKGSIPTITKQVSATSNTGYGSAIDTAMATTYYYKVTGTLPSDYADYDQYEYTITDSMSAGITFGSIQEVYVLHRGGGTSALIKDTHYTVSLGDDPEDGTRKLLTVSFENLKDDFDGDETKNDLGLLSTDQIIIVYTATLNENAVIAGTGNDNVVKLKYTNDPNNFGTGFTNTSETKTYTFELELVKVDGATHEELDGVTFYLYRDIYTEASAGNVAAQSTIPQYAVVNEDGEVVGWTLYKTAEEATAAGETNYELATLLTTENGKINVSGLDASVYYLSEVTAKDGYNLILDDIRVTVSATYSNGAVSSVIAESTYGSVAVLNDTQENVIGIQVTVPNYKGSVLPSTGGMGTTLFYAIGGLMVAGAVVLLVTKKRMDSED